MKHIRFTLMELVVVVAILTILFSMTLSFIVSAHDLTMKTVCLSNLKQIEIVTELHRKDNGSLPYEANWFDDFSYVKVYLTEGTELNIFTCPSDPEYSELVDSYELLNGSTSYIYIPSVSILALNIEDGLADGYSLDDIDSLGEFVIADNSFDHHGGRKNALDLFKEILPPIVAGAYFEPD
ncbi:MAG: hypothetical protein HRT88_08785, partial [Lentisphaeraceae bacterium]|nr:hypothetical protein [Lentisphaeraceae bacterium]